MSIEDVKQFYDTIVVDTDLRRRIIDANKKFSGSVLTELELEQLMAEEFLPLLKEEGFYFSIDELIEYQNKEIISSDKLKKVSGGAKITPNQAMHNLFNIVFNTKFDDISLSLIHI